VRVERGIVMGFGNKVLALLEFQRMVVMVVVTAVVVVVMVVVVVVVVIGLRVDQIWKEKDQDQNRLVLQVLEFGIGNLDC
jgi:hypothetical protein